MVISEIFMAPDSLSNLNTIEYSELDDANEYSELDEVE
jgi:hypothetical protein